VRRSVSAQAGQRATEGAPPGRCAPRVGAGRRRAASARIAWPHPPRVLIADAHEMTLEVYVTLLAQAGYEGISTRTGSTVLERVKKGRPDIAVLDIQMSELDGLSVIRQLRADPGLVGRPIIALTAMAMPGDRERCLAAGATTYLAKVALRDRVNTRI